MSKKTVSFKERPDDLEDFIDKLERQSNVSTTSSASPLPMLKRELTSLGNPWDVSNPALRQLCSVIPRKRESFGGSLKVLKGNIYMRRSHSVLKSVTDASQLKSKSLNIYPVLSHISPSFIPGSSLRSDSQTTDVTIDTPREHRTQTQHPFAENRLFGVAHAPVQNTTSEKKVFGLDVGEDKSSSCT